MILSLHVRCLGTIEQCTNHILKMCKDLALDSDTFEELESVEGYNGYCISKFEFYVQWNAS